MKLSTFAAACGVACLLATSAFAVDPATPAATPAASPSPAAMATPAAKPDKAAFEAKSQGCSKEADAKGLHGKERKKFRAKCIKGE